MRSGNDDMTSWLTIGDFCGEGPVWDPDSGCLYWTDIDGQRFFRYDHSNTQHEVVKQGLEVCRLLPQSAWRLCHWNSGGIWLWDGAEMLN